MEHAATYIHHISKELVHLMPIARFEGEVIVVEDEQQVGEAIAYLQKQSLLGVDTESRPSFTRGVHYPTALVQVATEDKCFLFRLSKIDMPRGLIDIFADETICKVGLAFKEDLTGLRRFHDFTPANCVDLQSIVHNYGIFDLGLQKIFAIVYGKKISKSQQLTNWESDKLTAEQAGYAATDAWATLLIYKALQDSKPLPEEEVQRLRSQEQEAQIQHQQEMNMREDVRKAVEVLESGGIIVYPTDTVWGIGCDATNAEAVEKLFRLKERDAGKSMLVLVDAPGRIQAYVQDVPEAAWDLLEVTAPEEGVSPKALTIIYPNARNVAPAIMAEDGSLGIRVTYEPFSHMLCEQLKRPIVSTSANLSGKPTPKAFCEIHEDVLNRADYVCHTRRAERTQAKPSSIVKVGVNNEITIIRP